MRKPILFVILLLTSLTVRSQKYVGPRELEPGTFGGEPEVKQKTKVNKSSDFDAQLGGFRNEFGVFRGIDATGFYWSGSENENEGSYRRFDKEAFVMRYHTGKNYGFSVRCIRND